MSPSWSTAASTASWKRAALAADRELQQRLLGVGRQEDDNLPPPESTPARMSRRCWPRCIGSNAAEAAGAGSVTATAEGPQPSALLPDRWKMPATSLRQSIVEASRPEDDSRRVFAIPFSERIGRTALVAGTFDTKGRELQIYARPPQGARHPDPHG